MARRKKQPPQGPNNGYLVSFGDTMTALLAFFIVLNTLAEEQTGADIHAGTGSFIEATDKLGAPGIFSDGMSRYRLQLDEPSPLYIVPDEDENESFGNASGPDEDGDNSWVRDREQEEYERFLTELERFHEIEPTPSVKGEVSFDRMKRLPRQEPLLDEGMREMLIPLAPLLRRPDYEIEIVVWATTPGPSAWTRSVRQARQLHRETKDLFGSAVDSSRLTAAGRPWLHSNVERPVVSVIVRRLQ
jgi:flagellar motor protein MotB